jgi:hypothetical protein
MTLRKPLRMKLLRQTPRSRSLLYLGNTSRSALPSVLSIDEVRYSSWRRCLSELPSEHTAALVPLYAGYFGSLATASM